MTLRSGRQIQKPYFPIQIEETYENSKEKEQGKTNEKEGSKSQPKEYERIIIRSGDSALKNYRKLMHLASIALASGILSVLLISP